MLLVTCKSVNMEHKVVEQKFQCLVFKNGPQFGHVMNPLAAY